MRLTVIHESGLRHTAHCRSHEVTIDLPLDAGGTNQGMNPPELLGAALGACIGLYVVEHCKASGLSSTGLQLRVDWRIAEKPRRLGVIYVHIDLPEATLSAADEAALLQQARHCLLSNTLLHAPSIELQVHGRASGEQS